MGKYKRESYPAVCHHLFPLETDFGIQIGVVGLAELGVLEGADPVELEKSPKWTRLPSIAFRLGPLWTKKRSPL